MACSLPTLVPVYQPDIGQITERNPMIYYCWQNCWQTHKKMSSIFKKSWSVRRCIGCGCLPFAPFSSQQLMCLGYNVASTNGLIGLLVLRGDYSMRELFKHITLFSSCSSEAKSNQSWTTSAAVSWVTAEVEPCIVSNECFTPNMIKLRECNILP